MGAPVSATFHGRDVFAPAAAHLASGVPLGDLGPSLATDEIVRADLPAPGVSPGEVVGTALDIDRFGNIELNVTMNEVREAGIERALAVETHTARHSAVVARTFGDVEPGDTVVYEDAYGSLAVAINRGSAAEALGAQVGTTITLRR